MQLKLFWILLFFCGLAFSQTDFYRKQTQKRIQPVGTVRVEGDESPASGMVNTLSTKADDVIETTPGAMVYEKHCKVCHQSGLAGAPKFRNSSMWSARIKSKGLDTLVSNAIKGINAMPPKGTCIKCSDNDIRQAVEYMVPQS